MNSKPFFSFGVTTYNRPELLKQTLKSIIDQTFSDFEVIVGNDYIDEPLTEEILDINDSRFRFVNRPHNVGEARNMNELLSMGRGRYFIWQNDDDLFAPWFLKKVYVAMIKFNFPPCIFTSYEFIYGTSFPDMEDTSAIQGETFSGQTFLRMYWSGKIKAIGCNGIFEKDYLMSLGGVKCFADSTRPLYSEHFLLMKVGMLDQIAYIDEPLVKYRIHETAWGCTTKEYRLYEQAGVNLLREGITVFSSHKLRDDFRPNIASVLDFVVINVFDKLRSQNKLFNRIKIVPFFLSLKKEFSLLRCTSLYWHAIICWCLTGAKLTWWLCTKFNFKAAMYRMINRK